MVYKTFLNQVASHIQALLGNRCSVHLEQVQKNNGLLLDGICIETMGELIAPTIYLNSYYQTYQQGYSMEEIYDLILEAYHTRGSFSGLSPTLFQDFSNLEDKIIYRLIHAQSNQELLQTIPHIPYLDLAVVFCIYLTDDENTQQMTAFVRNQHLTIWNLPIEYLESCAEQNTPKLLPASIRSLTQVMNHFSDESSILSPLSSSPFLPDPEEAVQELPLYILSNQNNIYGSACIRYPDVLKNFADSQNADVIILPSSIHEVLLTADSQTADYERLSQMVYEINQTEVPVEDRLSNQIYRYCRMDGSISIVSHCPESVGKWNP